MKAIFQIEINGDQYEINSVINDPPRMVSNRGTSGRMREGMDYAHDFCLFLEDWVRKANLGD